MRCERLARRANVVFAVVASVGLASFIGWASVTELTTVTRAPGVVVPSVKNQLVQHLEGGIVSEIFVAEGDKVAIGQPLVRLTDSRWTASLAEADVELAIKRVRRARLVAEAQGAEEFAPAASPTAADAAETEMKLFRQRAAAMRKRAAIYADQIRRLQYEITELTRRRENISIERGFVSERVGSLKRLADRKALSRNDLLSALTSLQQLTTKIDDIEFRLPQVEAELAETRGRLGEMTATFRAEAAEDLSAVDLEIRKLEERIAALKDRKARSDVRSPVAGSVNAVFLNTLGGVAAPGEPIVEIVPEGDDLVLEAELTPTDRGRVWPGMPAVVKVSAYDFSIYGGIDAVVIAISPDVIENPQGVGVFRVKLAAERAEFDDKSPILPGMSVDVDMISGEKTVLDYLLKPLSQLRERALRE